MMMRWYQQLFKHDKYLRFYMQFNKKKSVIHLCSSNDTIHTVSCIYNKHNYENGKIEMQERLKLNKSESNKRNKITEFAKIANIQLNQKTTFSKKLVDNSPSLIQPYLRLIRLDKPIGKIRINYKLLL